MDSQESQESLERDQDLLSFIIMNVDLAKETSNVVLALIDLLHSDTKDDFVAIHLRSLYDQVQESQMKFNKTLNSLNIGYKCEEK